MKLPSEFKIGKKTIGVTRRATRRGCRGNYYPTLNLISVKGKLRGEEESETFWHETTHAILHDMGFTEWANEAFVTAFSKRLNQVIRSAKF